MRNAKHKSIAGCFYYLRAMSIPHLTLFRGSTSSPHFQKSSLVSPLFAAQQQAEPKDGQPTKPTRQPRVGQLKKQKRHKYKRFKSSTRRFPKRRLIALIPQKPAWQLPLPKETIDYKNIALLRKCITAEGKILPRRVTGLNAKQQRYVSRAIKNCKMIGLLPFISIAK
uniref:Small ribosomal subunit protein bS18c n=1 Tax=Xylochloris irregularis TaxID=480381 RepID=A0A097KMC8_9CHLO|nr:ribosomal protein S18 [Xylochloris irregularis]AIT94346.1 ribosomal protein S18 [Xylochloris irregularis]